MNDITEISNRIKQLRLAHGMEQTDVAAYLGYKSFTTISKWENGKNLPDGKKLTLLAKLFNTTTDYILHGEETEHPLTSHPPDSVSKLNTELNQQNHTKWVDYGNELLEEQNQVVKEELYEYQVYEKLSAGTGSSYFNNGNYDTVYFDEELDYDFASWIYGDSMEPRFLNGEVALIKDTGFDYDGAIYAVEWDGQTYIKKVEREKDALRLISLNSKYKDKIAPYDEDPRIIGKIVGSFQPI